MFHSRRPFVRDRLSNHRRGNDNRFTAHLRPRRFRRNIDIHISLESITLHRLATDRAQLIVTRTFIHDCRVVVGNVRDVGGLIDNRDVAFGWQKSLLNARCAKFARCNETILVWAYVVIIVGPIANASALIKSRFGR